MFMLMKETLYILTANLAIHYPEITKCVKYNIYAYIILSDGVCYSHTLQISPLYAPQSLAAFLFMITSLRSQESKL
jgi:hypothetical protein